MTISNLSSKASKPIVTKFHAEPPGAEEAKICSNSPCYMTKMAAVPIYRVKTFKIFLSGFRGLMAFELDM